MAGDKWGDLANWGELYVWYDIVPITANISDSDFNTISLVEEITAGIRRALEDDLTLSLQEDIDINILVPLVDSADLILTETFSVTKHMNLDDTYGISLAESLALEIFGRVDKDLSDMLTVSIRESFTRSGAAASGKPVRFRISFRHHHRSGH
jgi:hypothetical protein